MDYHIALRIDSGLLAMRMLFKLTRLVMCLERTYRTYQKAMLMQLLILMYQQKEDLPSWQMFEQSVSVFNEEAGEMSFSVLSRVVLGDNLKMKFEHMNKMYKLTRSYSAASETLREEQGRKKRKNGYHLLTDKDREVFTVGIFMMEAIQSIRFNVFQQYPGKVACKNPAYTFATRAFENYTSETIMWRQFVRLDAQSSLAKYKDACTGTWAKDNNLHQVWPEYDNESRVAILRNNYASVLAREALVAAVLPGGALRAASESDSPSEPSADELDEKYNDDFEDDDDVQAVEDNAFEEEAAEDLARAMRAGTIAGLAAANRTYVATLPPLAGPEVPERSKKRVHK